MIDEKCIALGYPPEHDAQLLNRIDGIRRWSRGLLLRPVVQLDIKGPWSFLFGNDLSGPGRIHALYARASPLPFRQHALSASVAAASEIDSFSSFVTSGFSNCSGMVVLSSHQDEP